MSVLVKDWHWARGEAEDYAVVAALAPTASFRELATDTQPDTGKIIGSDIIFGKYVLPKKILAKEDTMSAAIAITNTDCIHHQIRYRQGNAGLLPRTVHAPSPGSPPLPGR